MIFRWKNRESYSAYGSHTASYMDELKVNNAHSLVYSVFTCKFPDQKEKIGFFLYRFHYQRWSHTLYFYSLWIKKNHFFIFFRNPTSKKPSDTPSIRFKWQFWNWSKYFSRFISFVTWIYFIFCSLNNKYIASKKS